MGRRTDSEADSDSATKHLEVSIVERKFGLFDRLPECKADPKSKIWMSDIPLENSNERSVALHSMEILQELLYELDLSGVMKPVEEFGTARLRPDVVMMLLEYAIRRRPCGGFEFKKKPERSNEDPMSHPRVLGEVYDQLMSLRNNHGVQHPLVVLSTYHSYRVCWLRDSVHVAEQVPVIGMDEPVTPGSKTGGKSESPPSPQTPSQMMKDIHVIEDDGSSDDGDDILKTEMDSVDERVVCASRVYSLDANEDKDIVNMLCSALWKMSQSECVIPAEPFNFSDDRRFACLTRDSCFWKPLRNVTLNWNAFPRTTQNLFLIEDLGKGSSGHAWLACSSSGSVCVLKFPHRRPHDPTVEPVKVALEREKENWIAVYPQHKDRVKVVVLNSRDVLMMPRFDFPQRETVADREEILHLVQEMLVRDFLDRGFWHNDVRWPNIGLTKGCIRGEMKKVAIMLDMEAVTRSPPENQSAWLDDVMTELRRKI
jgi:hypothetical protein